MTLDRANLAKLMATSIATTAVIQTATAVAALRKDRRDYADLAWGPGLGAIAVGSAALGSGDVVRRWTLAAATTGWAARLGHQMWGRITGKDEEDPRYTEFLEGDGTAAVVTKVFVTQALAQVLVSLPVQVAAASTLPRSARRWLFPLGAAVMVGGAVVEALADHQKQVYSERDDKPKILDTGLWAWSRHPNYFGDSLVWWGAWTASAASAPAGWTLPAPVAMSYFLVYATGARRTEKRMQEREGYRDYQRDVPFFVPMPWKHR